MSYSFKLSSGLFSLPVNAAKVDLLVVNHSSSSELQRIEYWVYRAKQDSPSISGKELSLAGHLEKQLVLGGIAASKLMLPPDTWFHSINQVAAGKPFDHTYSFYEIVVEGSDPKLLPTVQFLDSAGRVIPGTTIWPKDFVQI